VLVAGDLTGCRPVAADDPELRRRLATKPVGFSLDRLAENVRQRDSTPARLVLEHGQVVTVGSNGGTSASH
jgi:riboflavin biosynthesis pyrimidine reductase